MAIRDLSLNEIDGHYFSIKDKELISNEVKKCDYIEGNTQALDPNIFSDTTNDVLSKIESMMDKIENLEEEIRSMKWIKQSTQNMREN